MNEIIHPENLEFLIQLSKNNDREWFKEHKTLYERNKKAMDSFFNSVFLGLKKHDQIDQLKIFRIYRDVRFSKNKLPFKTHFAASFHRIKPQLRGGYYIHIQPNDRSFITTGFWDPEKDDLYRIRKEFQIDANDFRRIITDPKFHEVWGDLEGDELKTSPRDFDKDHPEIDLIKKKQFVFRKQFTDEEVLAKNFQSKVEVSFRAIRPFFDLMSEILTTDLNGRTII